MVGHMRGMVPQSLVPGSPLVQEVKELPAPGHQQQFDSFIAADFNLSSNMIRRKKRGTHPLYRLYAGTVAGDFTGSPALGVQNCRVCVLSEDHGETQPWCPCEEKDQCLWKEYALNTLFQVNCEQWHNTHKNNMARLNNLFTAGPPSSTLQDCSSLAFAVPYISLFRQWKSGKYFSFKVIDMIGEKQIVHLPQSAFCWEQELPHSPIWWIIGEVNCLNGLYTYHNNEYEKYLNRGLTSHSNKIKDNLIFWLITE